MGTKRPLRIGIDVGGTNTDAVVLDDKSTLIASVKSMTTTDVNTGLQNVLTEILGELGPEAKQVGRVMLGTTHATNAILQRRSLGRVGVIRIGAPAGESVPPLGRWPKDLEQAVVADSITAGGGFLVDGYPIARLDTDAIADFLERCKGRVDAFAVTSIFSPTDASDENRVMSMIAKQYGAAFPVSLSNEIGTLGLLERENATVLNAALYGVASQVMQSLEKVLAGHGLDALTFFAQNDGTLMSIEYAERFPVLTIGSGPANSIRGAAYLSGIDNAIVVDVGGTSTDLGVLVDGFPRESTAAVNIGGVHTNFRMPDVLSIAVGGGTEIRREKGELAVGPQSVGFQIREKSIVFGGGTPTLTDAATHAGRGSLPRARVDAASSARRKEFSQALQISDELILEAVDMMSLGRHDQDLVVVGGGSFIVPDTLPGMGRVHRPANGHVANAVGAAIALASGRAEILATSDQDRREMIAEASSLAIRKAIQAGAAEKEITIVEVRETPLAYLDNGTMKIEVKAAGPLG